MISIIPINHNQGNFAKIMTIFSYQKRTGEIYPPLSAPSHTRTICAPGLVSQNFYLNKALKSDIFFRAQ